jgi:hypothetical protein
MRQVLKRPGVNATLDRVPMIAGIDGWFMSRGR